MEHPKVEVEIGDVCSALCHLDPDNLISTPHPLKKTQLYVKREKCWMCEALMGGLRNIVTSTSVIQHPERFEDEVRHAIMADTGLIPVADASMGKGSSNR